MDLETASGYETRTQTRPETTRTEAWYGLEYPNWDQLTYPSKMIRTFVIACHG